MHRFKWTRPLAGALALAAVNAAPGSANDSVAEIGIGGIVLARTDAITLAKEDLFLSPTEVTVDYVFHNGTDADITSIVAFPLPDVDFDPETQTSLPTGKNDNFLGFEVTFDGKPIKPELDQRAFSLGVDVTELLRANGIPIYAGDEAVAPALAKLPDNVADDFISRGIITVQSYYESADGPETHERMPAWSMRSAYWWRATFPAGKDVKVHHRYTPAVGGAAGAYIFDEGKLTDTAVSYKTDYCLDDQLLATLKKKVNKDGYLPYSETWIDYILTSGGNWATGQIGEFKLTVDKGAEKNFVSFCGEGVKKVGPTRFEMKATDFYPEKDISILILQPVEMQP